MDNALLDLHNSSYPTQSHSIIAIIIIIIIIIIMIMAVKKKEEKNTHRVHFKTLQWAESKMWNTLKI